MRFKSDAQRKAVMAAMTKTITGPTAQKRQGQTPSANTKPSRQKQKTKPNITAMEKRKRQRKILEL